MRHCYGENIQVYEATGKNIANLLADVSKHLSEMDLVGRWVNITTSQNEVAEYIVTIYVH